MLEQSMKTETYERATDLPVSAREAFEWHLRPGALRRLMPPWENARVIAGAGPTERLEKGARQTIRLRIGPVPVRWVAEIADVQPDRTFFVDRQVDGPFRSWIHRHDLASRGKDASRLSDSIEYAPPMGRLGSLVGGRSIRRKLDRTFAWRHRVTHADLAAHEAARRSGYVVKKIAVTGAGGLVGRALCSFLRTGGHDVLELVRRTPVADHEVQWNPREGTVDHARLEGIDGLVHLAGEPIFALRWTEAKKRKIVESRVQGTRAIVAAIGALERPPEVLVNASAIGYYGDRGDELLTEEAAPGNGFLAETCEAWEAEVRAVPNGVREVRARTGVVLDPGGGALAKMLPAFKACVGGPLGDGGQWFPWLALDDMVRALHFALFERGLTGATNFVAPGEVRNKEFARILGSVLGRPAVLPVPRFALRAGLGRGQADQMLLASVRTVPAKLQELGFRFSYPDLRGALKHSLGRSV